MLAHTFSGVGQCDGRASRVGVNGTVLVVEDVRRRHFEGGCWEEVDGGKGGREG